MMQRVLVSAWCVLLVVSGLKVEEEIGFDGLSFENIVKDIIDAPIEDESFVPLSMIELESHESTDTPPFSVCKYLLETSAKKVSKGDSWPVVANHIATVRETLPPHVRSACDTFIRRHSSGIMSLLQLGDDEDDLLNQVTQEMDTPKSSGQSTSQQAPDTQSQQELFRKFWEDKGKYCGACLTMTKKIQKWLNMNCTKALITDRVMRMCGSLDKGSKSQCEGSLPIVRDYVINLVFKKFSFPNHCAYIGLCEKTMVVRALQNPLVMADKQNALLQSQEGSEQNMVQENEVVLQKAHATPNTAAEITFNLGEGGGISYRDVDQSLGEGLPKVFVDGSHAPTELQGDAFSLLETESQTKPQFDVTNPDDPHVTLHAQAPEHIHVPIMHSDLKQNIAHNINPNSYGLQSNTVPQPENVMKACSACQFTIGALYEFLSAPRTIRTILPQVKNACAKCNSAEEIAKCQEFVETHGVAFYQDVVRQGMPSKWCPRIKLCEMQYFIPAPTVLSDNYAQLKDKLTQVADF